MSAIDIVQDKINRVRNIDIYAIGMRVLENPGFQQQLIDFNKAQLNDDGVFADGQPTGEYSPKYALVREKAGLQTEHVDLKFTGAMQDSMTVAEKDASPAGSYAYQKASGPGVVIEANTMKGLFDLESRYPNILGLTDKSIAAIAPMFKELFVMEYSNEINKILYGS